MGLSVKHYFVSPKPDGPDSTLVQPSAWNHEHVLTMDAGYVLGRQTAGVGALEEIGPGNNIVFVGSKIAVQDNPRFTGTAGLVLPTGTTAQRDAAPVGGEMRYNSDTGLIETYTSAGWANGYDFQELPSATVYAANPLNLNAMTAGFGNLFNAATIDTIQLADGQVRTLYIHDPGVVLSAATNIILLPGGVGSLALRAGDTVTFRGYPGSGRVLLQSILRADGQALQEISTLEAAFDGGGAPIPVGAYVDIFVPYNFTLSQWTILGDRNNTIQIDMQYCTYNQYDGGASHPVTGDSICGGNFPYTPAVPKGQSGSPPSGWTRTYFGQGDILRCYVRYNDGIQKCTLALLGWHV